MNANHNNLDERTQLLVTEQMTAWGIMPEEITPGLISYTENVLQVPSSRIGDMVVQFGLATRDQIERLANNKPANIVLLEYLSEHIDNLRPHSQKLLAANDKLAYYDTLAHAPIHPEFVTNANLRAFCEEHYCLPLSCSRDNALRLVFADYSTQKDYAQRSRISRKTDAIGLLQQQFNLPDLVFGIAQREHILASLLSDGSENVATIDDEDKIAFWAENQANTANQKVLARILTIAGEKKASNVKFTPNHNGTVDIFYRRHGNLRKVPGIRAIDAVQADEINRFLHTKSNARYTDTAKRVEGRLNNPADGQFVFRTNVSETFLRCSFIPAANEGLSHVMESISIRLLPRDTVSIKLESINLSNEVIKTVRNYLQQTQGLILVVGPTSSGKSTTIAGIISEYLEIYGDTRNLLSLEQPVERHLQGITQFNVHQNKFEEGMGALLRHDPDFIWIGELRDRPSASTCIRSANTGHIVVSTLHSEDTPTAYNALLAYISNKTGSGANSVIVTEYDAISALALIIAQRLVPTLCPHCRLPIMHAGEVAYMDKVAEYTQYCMRNEYVPQNIMDTYLRNPDGCEKCNHEGYVGEVPVNEVLPISRSLRRKLISMANDGKNDLEILGKERTVTLYQEVMALVIKGQVAVTDAII